MSIAALGRWLIATSITLGIHLPAVMAQTSQSVDAIKTEFFVQSVAGQPVFCGVEFWIVFRDNVARKGEMSGANGSLAWTVQKNVFGMLLKVYAHDLTPSVVRSHVANGFIILKERQIKPDTTFHCEEKLGFCGVYGIEPSTAIFSALIHGQPLSVAFQRKPNVFDTVLPIELSQESVASDRFEAFLSCMKSITARIKSGR